MFLVGSTYGNWSVTNEGDADYAAVKLNSDGDVVWHLQVMAIFLDLPKF